MSGIGWSKAPWDGTGLPPVGTVCEALSSRTGDYRECEVLAHRNGMAVITFFDMEELQWAADFRPARTPEQIAAEERQKSIEKMISSIHPGIRQVAIVNSAYGYLKEACADLYDAGYRKTEAP